MDKMKTLTELYNTVQEWRAEQDFELTEQDIINLMHTQALLAQNEWLERIGDKLVEVATAIDQLRIVVRNTP